MNFCARSTSRKPGLFSDNGVCVAQNAHAARIGAETLARGGNAFDAATAISFALGVLEPWMSGIGGGGGLLFRDAGAGIIQGIDFGLVAPQNLDPSTYALKDGYSDDMFGWRKVNGDRNVTGVHAVATPGVVAGLGRLHAYGGKLPWADLLAPAIDLARSGVAGDWYSQIFISTNAARLRQNAAMADTFLDNGQPPIAIDLATHNAKWCLPGLADTLVRLAEAGWEDFYRGDLAREIARETSASGCSLGLADLHDYDARSSAAQNVQYRDAQVYLAPGLSAGKTLARTLELMPKAPGEDWHRHIALALQKAQAERWAQDGDITPPKTPDCTTHFSVCDSAGNLVSVTQTILSAFGAGVMLPQTGIILNNGMMWFDPEPGKPNSIGPGKRCLMNISPAILAQNDHYSALGAAGGRRILSAVAQLIGLMTDHGLTPEDAIHAPRLDCSVPGRVTVHPALAGLDVPGLAVETAPALPWPLTYAIPSVVTTTPNGSVAGADPVSPLA